MHGACYMDENGHNTIPSRRLWNRKQKVESSFHFPHTSSSICPFVLTQAWRGTPTAVSLGQTHSPDTSHSCFLLLSPPVLIFLSLSLRCHLSCPHVVPILFWHAVILHLSPLYFLLVLPCHPPISQHAHSYTALYAVRTPCWLLWHSTPLPWWNESVWNSGSRLCLQTCSFLFHTHI